MSSAQKQVVPERVRIVPIVPEIALNICLFELKFKASKYNLILAAYVVVLTMKFAYQTFNDILVVLQAAKYTYDLFVTSQASRRVLKRITTVLQSGDYDPLVVAQAGRRIIEQRGRRVIEPSTFPALAYTPLS